MLKNLLRQLIAKLVSFIHILLQIHPKSLLRHLIIELGSLGIHLIGNRFNDYSLIIWLKGRLREMLVEALTRLEIKETERKEDIIVVYPQKTRERPKINTAPSGRVLNKVLHAMNKVTGEMGEKNNDYHEFNKRVCEILSADPESLHFYLENYSKNLKK